MTPAPADILLVDDDKVLIAALSSLLAPLGRLRFATSGRDALRLARERLPDMVLLDVELPDIGGFEVCRLVKEDPQLADVPVIFLTSHDSVEEEVEGLARGAVDFIGKPLRHALVRARVQTHLRLKRLSDELRQAATLDGLTGAVNRRGFDDHLAREWLRAQRAGRPLGLLLIDIDHFKTYNDRHGHPAGDQILRAVVRVLQGLARRPGDRVARYGGDELAMLLPDTDRAGAQAIGQAVIEAVDRLTLPHAPMPPTGALTVSVGVACACPAGLACGSSTAAPGSAEALLAAADDALYEAKRNGRHQVRVTHGPGAAAGSCARVGAATETADPRVVD